MSKTLTTAPQHLFFLNLSSSFKWKEYFHFLSLNMLEISINTGMGFKPKCASLWLVLLPGFHCHWKQTKCPSTDECIKMWHIYTMKDYSAIKKEWNDAMCSNMDRPGDYYPKWSKSDRERQIYNISYMQNQKKMVQTYLQIGNRFTDLENKLTVTKWERWERVNWGFGIDMCTLIYIKQITNKILLYSTGNSTPYSVIT